MKMAASFFSRCVINSVAREIKTATNQHTSKEPNHLCMYWHKGSCFPSDFTISAISRQLHTTQPSRATGKASYRTNDKTPTYVFDITVCPTCASMYECVFGACVCVCVRVCVGVWSNTYIHPSNIHYSQSITPPTRSYTTTYGKTKMNWAGAQRAREEWMLRWFAAVNHKLRQRRRQPTHSLACICGSEQTDKPRSCIRPSCVNTYSQVYTLYIKARPSSRSHPVISDM